MTFLNFSFDQILPFFIGATILVVSIVCFNFGKLKTSLILLFSGALILGFFIANLDHFLMLWDEQYHALVAKNMMSSPFKPMLYSIPLLDYDYTSWTGNHVWLHKQPLFLWQMALSLKLFGINEMAVRIPSVVMHALATLMIFRIGKISISENVGYYGALFFAVAYFPLEMVVGKFATDHNDLIFLCYVTSSFWAWFEYSYSGKKSWLILTGIFAGCSVLVKWLPGLLVFATWTISIAVENRKKGFSLRSYFPVLIAACISCVLFIPWQVYVFNRFPLEAKNEYQHNIDHFTESLHGHEGTIWFHFKAFLEIYGSGFLVPVLYMIGVFLLCINSSKIIYRVTIASAIIITYFFFSFAKTKMVAFCVIVSPFFFLGLGALADSVLQFFLFKIKRKNINAGFRSAILMLICFFLMNFSKIRNYHTDWKTNDNRDRKADIAQMSLINKLKERLGNGGYVVFNAAVRKNGHIPIMFYSNYIAYDIIPTEVQIHQVRSKNYKIAVFDNGVLPNYIKEDTEILKISE